MGENTMRDYIEWYTHNLSEEKFVTVHDCRHDLLTLRKDSLEENDSICGHREYDPEHTWKGWETTFWLHAKANNFGQLKYT
jgi:hypothetical protein